MIWLLTHRSPGLTAGEEFIRHFRHRPVKLRLFAFGCVAVLHFAGAGICVGASEPSRVNQGGSLAWLVARTFPNLTHAERALVEFADVRGRTRGEFAVAGPSSVPNDPSNDPTHADRWNHDREVRAELIKWLCVDPDASRRVDPRGIRLLGARVTGKLDLSHIRVPFGISMIRCSIPEQIDLDSAEIPKLDLAASSTGEIFAPNMVVLGDADIGWDTHEYGSDFRASGEVYLEGARIGGLLCFGGGRFHSSPAPLGEIEAELRKAIDIEDVTVKGVVRMCCGFESQGAVVLRGANIGGALQCNGGHFINPGNVALLALSASIGGDVYLSEYEQNGDFEADGLVDFTSAQVGGLFYVHQAKFKGAKGSMHGLNAGLIDMQKTLIWQNVELPDGAKLNLDGAKVGLFMDDEQSWPKPGDLILDGFTYSGLAPPVDATSRLRWLALQPPGLHLQPYRQLAKVLRETGDEPGAIKVLIAEDDARYMRFGFLGALWGGFLKWTIGYGHRPLLALLWSLLVVMVGYIVTRVAKMAGVMRRTYPENAPVATDENYERLYPLLYSLDVFLPFVNLHQEHYWWPNSSQTGELAIGGFRLRVRGSLVLYYMWMQIMAGWLLSAIFVAGITGLMRSD